MAFSRLFAIAVTRVLTAMFFLGVLSAAVPAGVQVRSNKINSDCLCLPLSVRSTTIHSLRPYRWSFPLAVSDPVGVELVDRFPP
jgi:hypothetical protein